MSNTPRPLSTKEQVFIEAYLATWNATEAARRAGYKHANKIGPRKLVEVGVQQAINARLLELKMSTDEVLTRTTEQARGSLASFLRINDAGELHGFDFSDGKPLHLLRKATVTKRTIREMTVETVTVELIDSQAALFKLGEHHQLWGKTDILKHIDLSKLDTDQLERIANGENPLDVLINKSEPDPGASGD